MPETITPIPDLPPGLREAAIIGRLIPFVGAGASRIAGCPSWSEFADRALKFFVERGKLTYAQLDQLNLQNPRIKLSIAVSLQRQHQIKIDFDKLLHPEGNTDNPKGRRLYAALSRLGKTFVTTNYDRWLDTRIGLPSPRLEASDELTNTSPEDQRLAIYKIDEFLPHYLNRPNTVIHLHGSVSQPESMILTTQHYVRHYANDRMMNPAEENNVLTFLDVLFNQKTVLFVGYGLEELEILEYVIGKARLRRKTAGSEEIRHYLVQGFFAHEFELMRSLSIYYLECGIELLPFLRDHRDWDQMIDVIEAFALHAPAADPLMVEKLREMEGLADG